MAKQLELLQELIPSATKIAALTNPSNPLMERGVIQNAQAAGRRLGLEIIVVNATTEFEIDAAFALVLAT